MLVLFIWCAVCLSLNSFFWQDQEPSATPSGLATPSSLAGPKARGPGNISILWFCFIKSSRSTGERCSVLQYVCWFVLYCIDQTMRSTESAIIIVDFSIFLFSFISFCLWVLKLCGQGHRVWGWVRGEAPGRVWSQNPEIGRLSQSQTLDSVKAPRCPTSPPFILLR